MSKHRLSIFIVLISSCLAAFSPAFGGEKPKLPFDLPLPEDVNITAPDSTVPPALASFSGIWCGNWENTLDTCILVEKVGASGATILRTWGDASKWNVSRGHQRVEATGDAGKLLFASPSGKEKFEVSLFDAKTMELVRVTSRMTKTTTLKKVD